VQSGVGRTGTLFAFQQFDVQPDVITFAKGIAGGLPMGGIIAGDKCAAVLTAGTHATTFGGNPVAAAGAIEVLRQLDDATLDEVTKKGEYIREEIQSWNIPYIGEIRGRGLMIGISLTDAEQSAANNAANSATNSALPKKIAGACVENGLLILTAGTDALRMLPPLTITYDELDKGLKILKAALLNV